MHKIMTLRAKFLSTLPARGATSTLWPLTGCWKFLSTLPARGATVCACAAARWRLPISIHAPREGSDCASPFAYSGRRHFYPRSPRGERHDALGRAPLAQDISIHAPREGSDGRGGTSWGARRYFYPRSPRGERPPGPSRLPPAAAFLSTLPARGATCKVADLYRLRPISIHAPREGSDCVTILRLCNIIYFYPRSPRGERRLFCCLDIDKVLFLSTLPARGATDVRASKSRFDYHFYPRSPRGERQSPVSRAE